MQPICVFPTNARIFNYECAKGNNVPVFTYTDAQVITLRCCYVYVLWEYDCIKAIRRTYYTAPAASPASTHH